MRKIFVITFLIQLLALPQSTSFDFHSPQNIKLFADHLFCESDYLRAIEEYDLIDSQFVNDTIDFKMMLSYSNLGLFKLSNEVFKRIYNSSIFYPDGYLLSMKNELLINSVPLDYPVSSLFNLSQQKSFNRLVTVSKLYGEKSVVTKKDFLSVFAAEDQDAVSHLYNYKFDQPYKSPTLAGIFSIVIPGSGKMYVGEWGDGITSLLVTGLFAFLAYDNFQADHTARAWLFTGVGAFFYAGNIYGSIAAAQIFNAKIDFEFSNGLKVFLENKNYFLPDYDFCN
jgi:TM2 domain-containing membrane protein YozV